MKNISNNLNNLTSKVDKLKVDKLVLVPVDLSKLNDVLKNDVVKKTEYKDLVKKVSNIKATDTSDVVKKIDYNTKINGILKKLLLIMIMINILLLKQI